MPVGDKKDLKSGRSRHGRRRRAQWPRGGSPAEYANVIGQFIGRSRLGVFLLIVVSLLLLVVVAYFSWVKAVPGIIEWANETPLRWTFSWMGVLFAAFAPLYFVLGVGSILVPAIQAVGTQAEQQAFDELDKFEDKVRGSADPVDYAQYGRKALKAYYLMGQNQVRLSFYIGVAAMIFGFAFLLAGLIAQTLDVSNLKYLRKDLNVSLLTVGGGLIIEFIAATFLWIYRAAIVQLNVYYRNQILVHSALISVAVSAQMGRQREAALRNIIETMLTPKWEGTPPELPKLRGTKARKSGAPSDASKNA